MDFKSMNLDELSKISEELSAEIEVRRSEARKSAIEKIKEEIKRHSLTAKDLGFDSDKKQKRAPSTTRYVDPKDSNKTWTGRGRKPAWIQDYEKDGGNLDDLKKPASG